MGLDFLDLEFHIEKEFNINISYDEMRQFLLKHPSDARISDYALFVKAIIKEQHGKITVDVLERVQFHVSVCLDIPIESVTPDAWFVRDLGME